VLVLVVVLLLSTLSPDQYASPLGLVRSWKC